LNVVQGYMVRSEGSALHASIGTMSGCVLNIILDPIFILPWGLNMGAAGAGLATFVANCFACLYFLMLARVKRGNTFVCMDPRKLKKLTRREVLGILGVGIPASIQNLLNVTGSTILNNFTARYGATAVAAMGISHKLNMVPIQVALGFSQGVMPLVSYNYANGNRKRMKSGILFAMKVILPVMAVVTLGYWIFAPSLIQSFLDDVYIIAYGTRFLRGMCLCMVFLCVDFLAVGVFQALGMGRKALIFAVLRKVALEIPLLFVLNTLFPLYGLPYAQVVSEVILSAVAVIMLRQIFQMKNINEERL